MSGEREIGLVRQRAERNLALATTVMALSLIGCGLAAVVYFGVSDEALSDEFRRNVGFLDLGLLATGITSKFASDYFLKKEKTLAHLAEIIRMEGD